MEFSNPTDAPFNLFLWQNTIIDGEPNYCVPKFSDPRNEIMAGLNEIMVRCGALYGSQYSQSQLQPLLDAGLSTQSNFTGTVISPVNIFRTDFAYFAGAAVIQLFTILAVLVTFWGWWSLGRDFSLSPLEIGKVGAQCNRVSTTSH